jgi:sortase A
MIPAVHRFLTLLSTALITAGVVILADVGVTLAWEEPVSSIYGAIQQQRAEGQLEDLQQSFLAEHPVPEVTDHDGERAARKLADAFEAELQTGEGIGRIEAPGMDLDAVIVEGDDTGTLQKGPGRYPDTALPGQGKTIGIAGHRTTYLAPFRNVDKIEEGEEVVVEMPYGSFAYEVQKTEIVEPTDVGIVDDVGYERLVLTACHPLYSASQRYAVFARLTDVTL